MNLFAVLFILLFRVVWISECPLIRFIVFITECFESHVLVVVRVRYKYLLYFDAVNIYDCAVRTVRHSIPTCYFGGTVM